MPTASVHVHYRIISRRKHLVLQNMPRKTADEERIDAIRLWFYDIEDNDDDDDDEMEEICRNIAFLLAQINIRNTENRRLKRQLKFAQAQRIGNRGRRSKT